MASGFPDLILNERYEITRQLGAGGMGIVFQAHDQLLDREVAVKLIRPEYAPAPAALNAFLHEARTIARLEHPNILAIHDLGAVATQSGGLPFLVMQLARGGSLADWLKGGSLPLPEVQRIVSAVCAALDYAHGRGVIHLDIKPLNILFDEHNNPLVGDLGLAKLLEGAAQVKADTRAGTLAYMAPEQLFGSQAGPFTDVYALGITVYEMLTRALPRRSWDGAVQFDDVLPDALLAILRKATQADPGQRYSSVGALAQALQQVGAPERQMPPRVAEPPATPMSGDLPGVIDSQKAIEEASRYFDRGVARFDKGDLDGAIADWTQAIRLNPQLAEAYTNRGLARAHKGDLDGAIADFEMFLKLGGGVNDGRREQVQEILRELKGK